jgi:hypothetical protein
MGPMNRNHELMNQNLIIKGYPLSLFNFSFLKFQDF